MPFEPLNPEDNKEWKFCKHPEHNPPGYVVITEPCKYRCPGCGKSIILYPNDSYSHTSGRKQRPYFTK